MKKNSKTIPIGLDVLRETLYFLDDIMGRAQVLYFLRGKTLKDVINNKILDSKIEIGMRERYLTEYGENTLRSFFVMDKQLDKKGRVVRITTEHKAKGEVVPIEIKVYHGNYKVIKHLDHVTYQYDTYPIPNPAGEFIKSDGILR